MQELKTSAKWQELFPYPKVLDPDGWDRRNFIFSWNEELISKKEYDSRVFVSTCEFKLNNSKDE